MSVEQYEANRAAVYTAMVRALPDPCMCGCGRDYHGRGDDGPVTMCVSGVCSGCDRFTPASDLDLRRLDHRIEPVNDQRTREPCGGLSTSTGEPRRDPGQVLYVDNPSQGVYRSISKAPVAPRH